MEIHFSFFIVIIYCSSCAMFAAADVDVEGHMPPSPRRHAMDARHETDHIKEHLSGIADKTDLKDMTPEELEFHYFKLHDYDDNNKLDGLEIAKALTHFERNDNEILPESAEPALTDVQLAELIDSVLQDEDGNKDGYVDYSEFVAAQRREGHGDDGPDGPKPPVMTDDNSKEKL